MVAQFALKKKGKLKEGELKEGESKPNLYRSRCAFPSKLAALLKFTCTVQPSK